MNTVWRVFLLFFVFYLSNCGRDYCIGKFNRNNFLVAQDPVFKGRVPFRRVVAEYGRVFKCPITYFRVVDRLGYGGGPNVKVIRGGLGKKYIVARLTSPYNIPISVNVYIGCEHKTTTTSNTDVTAEGKGTTRIQGDDSIAAGDKTTIAAGGDDSQQSDSEEDTMTKHGEETTTKHREKSTSKAARKDSCYIKEIGTFLGYGVTVTPVGHCLKITCGSKFIKRKYCGKYSSSNPDCDVTEEDLTKTYPECCPHLVCEQKKEAGKDGCYIEEIDKVIGLGVTLAPVGYCFKVTCGAQNIIKTYCRKASGECPDVEDLTKPYPDCCPRAVCETRTAAGKDGCYIKEIDKVVGFGVTKTPAGHCFTTTCGIRYENTKRCASSIKSNLGCTATALNLAKPFPKCCPYYECKSTNAAGKDGCYIKKIDKVVQNGDTVTPDGDCSRITCGSKYIKKKYCAPLEDDICSATDEDLTKSFPKCCPHYECKSQEQIRHN